MAKRNASSHNIGDLLKTYIKESKLEKGLNKVTAEEAWHHIMGPPISKYTTKVMLNGNILVVHLSSSVLREELSYGKEKIISMVNEFLDAPLVSELVLK
ncbi:DUF721 domain-containing protein [Flavobacteriaceae bacterium]|nr:DUF721 domain-containing protein [Flavobacteriaceae bacterium]MDC0637518.1 DUF721 domain-containing protein [Flavobacteriaceae bacterium]